MSSVKASDIDDRAFLAVVLRRSLDGKWAHMDRRWVLFHEMYDEFPDMPWKVVHAKGRQLLKRGLLDGCGCGCRGDLELTDAGLALLSPHPEENP